MIVPDMGLLENQSVMSEPRVVMVNPLRRSSHSGSSRESNMDRYSLLSATLLLEQIQARKQEKEQAFVVASEEIKNVTKAVIRDVKMQEEQLLDQLWTIHRMELSNLQKTHQDIKRKITDMITIRDSIKRERHLRLDQNRGDLEPSMNSELQVQVERQIEVLTAEGCSVLHRTQTALVFSNEMPDFSLGKLQEKPLKSVEEMNNVHLKRERRNTVLSFPDVQKPQPAKPALRKARSTDDIFKKTTQIMTLAFEMTNEDLLPDRTENPPAEGDSNKSFAINKSGAEIGQIYGPRDLTYLPNGDIVITEFENKRLQKFSPTGEALQLMKSEELKPCGVTMTKDGYIAVIDKNDNTIKILTQCGDKICQFGTGYFHNLSFLDTDSDDNYVVIDNTGTWQHCVFVYNAMTGIKKRIGYKDDTYIINHPEYVHVDKNDNIIISDSGKHCVWVFTSDGKYSLKFGQHGNKPGDLCYPKGVYVDQSWNYLVADCANHRICQYNYKGHFVKVIADRTHGVHYPQVVTMNNSHLTVVQHSTVLFIDTNTLDL